MAPAKPIVPHAFRPLARGSDVVLIIDLAGKQPH
jgi:hypothetical protein